MQKRCVSTILVGFWAVNAISVLSVPAEAKWRLCSGALDVHQLRLESSYHVEIDRVSVTGSSFKTIRQNLSLDEIWPELSAAGKSILTVGEGKSELLPELRASGFAVQALDLWYHSRLTRMHTGFYNGEPVYNSGLDEMIRFQRQYRDDLVRGDATAMPFEDESKDFVLSHLLANNLHIADQLRFFSETVRILRVGGKARILLSRNRPSDFPPQIQELILGFLEVEYGDAIDVSIDTGLLKITKLADTRNVRRPIIPFDANVVYEQLRLPPGARLIREVLEPKYGTRELDSKTVQLQQEGFLQKRIAQLSRYRERIRELMKATPVPRTAQQP